MRTELVENPVARSWDRGDSKVRSRIGSTRDKEVGPMMGDAQELEDVRRDGRVKERLGILVLIISCRHWSYRCRSVRELTCLR
jgi:hypothetical protein